jgi:hypothetical protein
MCAIRARSPSAYRFLLADLMPFGKRAVIRFEHGGENQSTEHYRSVTYWYGVDSPSLVKTDALDVGDVASEEAHRYVSPDAGPPYTLTSRYEWGVDHTAAPAPAGPVARPRGSAEFVFQADAGTTYAIWVRGKTAGGIHSDASWFQFDDLIGSDGLGTTYGGRYGFGNWRDRTPAGAWAWSSGLPQEPPQTVTFTRTGRHRLRIQPRHGGHVIDQIWLSSTQKKRPAEPDPVAKPAPAPVGRRDQIVLDASDARKATGTIAVVEDASTASGMVLRIGAGGREGASGSVEVYPAHTETCRATTSLSAFTLRIRSDNLGVMLRRTLDYRFPNQRAKVYVAEADSKPPAWQYAGVWYLAGSNTCYHSYPSRKAGGELVKSNPVVQTSNRRFRDDEFLVPRELTRGRAAIRVRVEFTPVDIPLLPGRPVGEQAWSEIRYAAYCYVMPEIRLSAE